MSSVRHEILRGEALFGAGRYREAYEVFTRVIEDEPHHSAALNDAGMAAAELGLLDDAATYFERALAADPFNLLAFYNLLDVALEQGNLALAQQVFRQHQNNVPDGVDKEAYREALFAS